MLRKAFLIVAIVALTGLALTGCKKSNDESDTSKPKPPQVKTTQDYNTEAENQITRENMETELEKLEKEIEKDIQIEP